jgi:AraC-like DNA-binding protein
MENHPAAMGTFPPLQIRNIFYREAGRDYRIDPHVMNGWQWYFVQAGKVRSTLNRQTFHLTSGQSTIVSQGINRDRCYDGSAPRYVVAEFDTDTLQLDDVANRPLELPPELNPDVQALVHEIRSPVHLHSTILIQILLARILIGLHRAHSPVSADRRIVPSTLHASRRADIVQRVDDYLSHNFRNPIQRDTVARALNLSASHLARLYRSEAGMTLAQKLRELRMDHAKRLLLETTLTVTNIAMEVGFDSFSHFAALFHRSTGLTPSDYRRSGGTTWS